MNSELCLRSEWPETPETATDYYDVLGIGRYASDEAIVKAYRRLAHKHHPDHQGDETRFGEASHAYYVLSDMGRRTEYDASLPLPDPIHLQTSPTEEATLSPGATVFIIERPAYPRHLRIVRS